MFDLIKSTIKDMATEKDGVSYCPARILWVLGTVAYIGFTVYQIYTSTPHVFEYVNFATGFAAIQASGAAAVRIKVSTEQ